MTNPRVSLTYQKSSLDIIKVSQVLFYLISFTICKKKKKKKKEKITTQKQKLPQYI